MAHTGRAQATRTAPPSPGAGGRPFRSRSRTWGRDRGGLQTTRFPGVHGALLPEGRARRTWASARTKSVESTAGSARSRGLRIKLRARPPAPRPGFAVTGSAGASQEGSRWPHNARRPRRGRGGDRRRPCSAKASPARDPLERIAAAKRSGDWADGRRTLPTSRRTTSPSCRTRPALDANRLNPTPSPGGRVSRSPRRRSVSD